MNYDYAIPMEEREILSGRIGKELKSVLVTDSSLDSSFEVFVLRFADVDVEIVTREISDDNEWFDETNTMQVVLRPGRDSYNPLFAASGKQEPFHEMVVNKRVTDIGIATSHVEYDDGSEKWKGSYSRGLLVRLDGSDVIFDKGCENWSAVWRLRAGQYHDETDFHTEDDKEYPQIHTRTEVSSVK